MNVFGSVWPSALQRHSPPDGRLFAPAKGRERRQGEPFIDLDAARVHPFSDPNGGIRVGRPDRSGQSHVSIVGLGEGVFHIAEAHKRQVRAELPLPDDTAVFGRIVDQRGGNYILDVTGGRAY